jgi:NTP pyrophosphatase (non-canonical NTP hydrolase)
MERVGHNVGDTKERAMDIREIQAHLASFAAEREWDQFHSPKNLSMALAGEAGELLEHFQWLSEEQSINIGDNKKKAVAEELADVFIYAVRLADKLAIDLESAVRDKLEANAKKYPWRPDSLGTGFYYVQYGLNRRYRSSNSPNRPR